MRTLLCLSLLSLTCFSTGAFAGTLECKAPRLAYSYDATDGGAPRGPRIELTLGGRTLIHVEPFGGNALYLASFELSGRRTVLDVEKTLDYVMTTFRSAARVTKAGSGALLFRGAVLCHESRYVGPPRP